MPFLTTESELRFQPPLAVTFIAAGSHLGRPHTVAHGGPVSAPSRPPARGGGRGRRDARRPGRRALGLTASGATCVQRLDGSRDSAIHTKYRISLRSSSMREPRYPLPRVVLTFRRRPLLPRTPRTGATGGRRFIEFSLAHAAPGFVSPHGECSRSRRAGRGHGGRLPPAPIPRVVNNMFAVCFAGFDNDPSAGSPTETLLRLLLPLNDKVQWTSRDVAGSEPPTSPRSEHFTGPFNR